MCDEPTGSLDGKTGDEIFGLLLSLCRENGKALILVTHNLILAEQCALRIKMEDGKMSVI